MTMGMDLASAQVASTVVLNLSVAALLGASAANAWLRIADSQWATAQLARLRTATLAAVALALTACVALLWFEAASMAEVPVTEAAEALVTVLTSTHYGIAWAIGIGALAVVALVSAIRWSPPRAPAAGIIRIIATGIFLYSRSTVSHAGAAGDISWAVAADWLHLVFVSLWVGEVLIAALVTFRQIAGPDTQERLDRAVYAERLSHSATVALVGIVATGLFSAWRSIGSLDNAMGNTYANILIVKLLLVACAALLGGVNRFLVMPGMLAQLQHGPAGTAFDERRFAMILRIEAVILGAALVLAAILSSTSPPTAG